MLSVSDIAKKAKLSRKTVYKVFYGTASLESAKKVQKSIFSLIGKSIPIKEIVKGRYSDNCLIKSLCQFTENQSSDKSVHFSFLSPFDLCARDTDDVDTHCFELEL